MRLPYTIKPRNWRSIDQACHQSVSVRRSLSTFVDLWITVLLQEKDAATIRQELHNMLDHMLAHGLPDAKPGCIKKIGRLLAEDIDAIPDEPELPEIPPDKGTKIANLIRLVDTQYGKAGSRNRLNYRERMFFLKHKNRVLAVFNGELKHNRAKKIMRKMQSFGLGAEDVETVFKALSVQEASKDIPADTT